MKNLDKNLISFCITQRQKDIFQSVLKTGSVFESARELRTSQRWIHRTIHNIKQIHLLLRVHQHYMIKMEKLQLSGSRQQLTKKNYQNIYKESLKPH